jgi:hypothetical protein
MQSEGSEFGIADGYEQPSISVALAAPAPKSYSSIEQLISVSVGNSSPGPLTAAGENGSVASWVTAHKVRKVPEQVSPLGQSASFKQESPPPHALR